MVPVGSLCACICTASYIRKLCHKVCRCVQMLHGLLRLPASLYNQARVERPCLYKRVALTPLLSNQATPITSQDMLPCRLQEALAPPSSLKAMATPNMRMGTDLAVHPLVVRTLYPSLLISLLIYPCTVLLAAVYKCSLHSLQPKLCGTFKQHCVLVKSLRYCSWNSAWCLGGGLG